MSYVFRSAGTIASGTGALSPGAPAGKAVGDLLLLTLVSRDNGQTAPPVTGYTLVSPASPVGWNYLYARIADGTATDTPTGLDYTGTPHAEAQIAAFSGGGYPLGSIVANSVSENGTNVSILYTAGLTIAPADCLVIAIGTKNKTATSNGTTINDLSGFTKIDSYDGTNNGTDISQWWGFQVQTTAANIPGSLTQTLTGTTETLQYTSLLVALKSAYTVPAAVGTYAYTGQDITFTTSQTGTPYLLAAAGVYNYSLAHASSDLELTADSAGYSYVGNAAQFPVFSFNLNASSGNYTYVGKTITFTITSSPDPLIAASGAYAYTGELAIMDASALPPFIELAKGIYAYSGFDATLAFNAPGTFPNVIGLPLQQAQQALEAAGVLVPADIGYFGTWPITITWVESGSAAGTIMGSGIVVAQNPAPYSGFVVNGSIVLTVTEIPVSVATPPSEANF